MGCLGSKVLVNGQVTAVAWCELRCEDFSEIDGTEIGVGDV